MTLCKMKVLILNQTITNNMETEIQKFLNTPREYKALWFEWICQWDSFIFWHKMNWRNLTFINLTIETNCYSKYFELEFIILGLGFTFDWHRPFETNKDIIERIDE